MLPANLPTIAQGSAAKSQGSAAKSQALPRNCIALPLPQRHIVAEVDHFRSSRLPFDETASLNRMWRSGRKVSTSFLSFLRDTSVLEVFGAGRNRDSTLALPLPINLPAFAGARVRVF